MNFGSVEHSWKDQLNNQYHYNSDIAKFGTKDERDKQLAQ